ncbi:hypothetical protein HMPREF3160_00730 [Arthrobacter sp. HMSC06H05]|nr:hypothetical protein HMPREF3160_00730 [Arthrobacter sp. HMSC06H05]
MLEGEETEHVSSDRESTQPLESLPYESVPFDSVKEWVRAQPVSGSSTDKLRPAVLIAAFGGFENAGHAATSAVEWILEHVDSTLAAKLDPEEYYDFLVNRPSRVAGVNGNLKLAWPTTRLYRFRTPTGLDVVVALGPEPNMRWISFVGEVLMHAEALNVVMVTALHATAEQIPHSANVQARLTSDSRALRSLTSADRSVDVGPAGIVSVLSDTAWAAGLPVLDVWVDVPRYVAALQDPKAQIALIAALDEHFGLDLPTDSLRAHAEEWEEALDAAAAEDPRLATLFSELKQQHAQTEQETPQERIDGEAIAEELRRYLSGRDDLTS